MAQSVRIQAAAKVNLHLRVYDRRADGFHGILSIFQAVSLSDTLVIRSLKASASIEIDGVFDCPARATTIYKAAQAYLEASGIKAGLSISVEKRIPAGGGLGGGSSDAAATLLGLDALLGGKIGPTELERLGAGIGSDVPFFLGAAAALVTGRGEIVEPIEAREDFRMVLAFPGFPVSTAWAYGLLDRSRVPGASEADPGEAELREAYRGDIGLWPFANSFEALVGEAHPRILEAKASMEAEGALFSAMSGSGSSVFGVFDKGADREGALLRLAAEGFEAWPVSPLARCMSLD
jgi:4-diphosphocytidyl-2-C-methyl-D-erythritol kinase